MEYKSKSISLAEDVWAAFNQLREAHGSYNKALRKVLNAGGVFESEPEHVKVEGSDRLLLAGRDNHSAWSVSSHEVRPRKPLLKPSEKKK